MLALVATYLLYVGVIFVWVRPFQARADSLHDGAGDQPLISHRPKDSERARA